MDPELTRKILSAEIRAARDYGEPFKWEIVSDLDALTVTATLHARDGERFIVHFECTGYKEVPPLIDFIDPNTGVLGTTHAYPKSHDSLFHPNGPCICAPFNRKAYGSIHKDWSFANWTTSKVNNTDWSSCSTIAGMLAIIQSRLDRGYLGRMG